MLNILKKNWLLYALLTFYFIVGAILLYYIEKGDMVRTLNIFHSSLFDWFFRVITFIGDGIFSLIVIAVVWPINRYKFVVLAINSVVVGVVVQLLKKTVFSAYHRPVKILGEEGFYFIEGLTINRHHSFPSGHTASAFALLVMIALLYDNKKASLVFVLLAILAAISRVYLFQHFYIDTYFGALLAVCITTLTYYLLEYQTRLKERLS